VRLGGSAPPLGPTLALTGLAPTARPMEVIGLIWHQAKRSCPRARSGVERTVSGNTVHLSIDMGSNLPIFISGATYGQDCRTT